MKKILSFILATVLLLSAFASLTVVGGAEGEATPSQEITHFNLSLKASTHLLFAVPAEGYKVNPDGSVDNLELLLWESDSGATIYNRQDAVNKGAVIQSSGIQKIGKDEVPHLIFTYDGLSASEMTKNVYVRTVYTNANGSRSYSELYDYSVTEFAMGYSGDYAALVAKMLAYGDACEAHYNKEAPYQSYKATEAKSLVPIKVTTKLGGQTLVTQTTQLAKVGDTITLKAPFVDGATFASWNVPDVDDSTEGTQVVVQEDATYVASYNYTAILYNDHETSKLGAYASSITNDKEFVTGEAEANANNISGSYACSSKLAGATTASSSVFAKFVVCGDEDNKYIKYAHDSAGQVGGPYLRQMGIGDSISQISMTISVKAPDTEGATIPDTQFRLRKPGPASNNGGDLGIIYIKNNAITLGGDAISGTTNVIAVPDSTKFIDITAVIDFEAGLIYGYADGVLTATTKIKPGLAASNCIAGLEQGNTTFDSNLFGGWQGADLKNKTVKVNGVDTPIYDSETSLYNVELLEQYVENYSYFYYDNLGIYAGDITK